VTALALKDEDGSEVLSVTMVTNTSGLENIFVNGEVLEPMQTLWQYDPVAYKAKANETYTGTKYYSIPPEYAEEVNLSPMLDFGGIIEIALFASATETATGESIDVYGRTFLDIVDIGFNKKSVRVAEGKFTDSFGLWLATPCEKGRSR
jgi:hypothetical protein